MCESEFDASSAIETVVGAMSERVVRHLLEELIGYQLGDCGDVSNVEQMTQLVSGLMADAPSPYYKVDVKSVRPVLTAAATACSMLPGPGPTNEFVAQLARCAATGQVFDHIIQ
jgi:hypothetical protein